MKYRIVQDTDGKYRIQYQEKKFIFFGKPVWKYIINIAGYDWETENLEDANKMFFKLMGKQKVIKEV